MNIEKTIRSQAKSALNGKWVAVTAGFFLLSAVVSLLITLVYVFGNFFCIWTEDDVIKNGYETAFTVIVCISVLIGVFLSPFKNGFLKLCYDIVSDKEADFGVMFYFFKRNKYLTTIQFNLIMAVKIIINILIGLIPYFILSQITYFFSIQLMPTVTANEIVFYIKIALVVLGIIFAVIRSVRLFITEFLYIENDADEKGIFQAARKINKKHGKSQRKLFYGFIPWIALCFFVLPMIYVFPYLTATFANSSKWLIKLYKEGKIEW